MKSQRFLFGSMLVLVILFGCTQVDITPQTSFSSTSTYFTNTVTSTITITSAPTNTNVNVPTLIPTQTVEDARVRLIGLLASNNNCSLPCLWGLIPGNSTYQDAYNILAPLSAIADPVFMNLSSSPGSIDLSYFEDDLQINTHVGFLYGVNNIISRITFKMRDLKKVSTPSGEWIYQDTFDSKTFNQQARAYMLPTILTKQGIPAAVLLQTSGSLVLNNGGFRILLFYPEQGLLIHYEMQMKISGDTVSGCPANSHIEIEISTPGQPDAYSKMLSQTEWSSLWPVSTDNDFWKPIEKATSMSLEQFYEKYSKDTNMCIETPASIWPIP